MEGTPGPAASGAPASPGWRRRDPGVETHDGFFWQPSLGFGALIDRAGGATSTSPAFVSQGGIGGTLGRGFVLGLGGMTAFAIDWLDKLFGADIKKAIKRTQATQWAFSPYVMGSMSAAAIGSQATRRILMEPIFDRVYYAGEAAHETLYGTVGGAWESGERAADSALRVLGVVTATTKPEGPVQQPLQRAPKAKRRR